MAKILYYSDVLSLSFTSIFVKKSLLSIVAFKEKSMQGKSVQLFTNTADLFFPLYHLSRIIHEQREETSVRIKQK